MLQDVVICLGRGGEIRIVTAAEPARLPDVLKLWRRTACRGSARLTASAASKIGLTSGQS